VEVEADIKGVVETKSREVVVVVVVVVDEVLPKNYDNFLIFFSVIHNSANTYIW
jgi:hypothetical protein